MFYLKFLSKIIFILLISKFLYSCGTGADARQFPPEPEKRVKKNMEEGRGFRLMNELNKEKVQEILNLQAQTSSGAHL